MQWGMDEPSSSFQCPDKRPMALAVGGQEAEGTSAEPTVDVATMGPANG